MKPAESFVEQPIRSLQTMLRVIAAYDSAMPNIVPDGIYGQSTLTAVTAFQRRNALPVTGVVNQQTWDTIVSEYTDALVQVGNAQPISILLDPAIILESSDRGAYVYLLQSMLIYLSQLHEGISRPAHSGVMDEDTQHSLKGFQTLSGLPQTGEADRMTWKYLSLMYTLNANIQRSEQ